MSSKSKYPPGSWFPIRRKNRPRKVHPFYHCARWRRISKAHREANPYCAAVLSPSCWVHRENGAGMHVHHIDPRRACEDPYDESNLRTVCPRCHPIVERLERGRRG